MRGVSYELALPAAGGRACVVKADGVRAELELVERDELVGALRRELEQARGERDEISEIEDARRELELALRQRESELGIVKADVVRAELELVERDELVGASRRGLEQARGERDGVSEIEDTRRELEVALRQREAELAVVKAELSRANEERNGTPRPPRCGRVTRRRPSQPAWSRTQHEATQGRTRSNRHRAQPGTRRAGTSTRTVPVTSKHNSSEPSPKTTGSLQGTMPSTTGCRLPEPLLYVDTAPPLRTVSARTNRQRG